jgi:hypothetical protein
MIATACLPYSTSNLQAFLAGSHVACMSKNAITVAVNAVKKL